MPKFIVDMYSRSVFQPISVAVFCLILLLGSCQKSQRTEVTPFGTTVGEESVAETPVAINDFTLSDIMANGELIMLTLSGPETYYDYHGRGMGTQFLLCENFAHSIGVSLRVELCQDTAEMVQKLQNGEGDIIAFPLEKNDSDLIYCGYSKDSLNSEQWAVREGNTELADTLNRWFRPELLAEIKKEETLMATNTVKRKVYSPMLSRSGGVISRFDALFQKYAATARWDWRLLAAQCYQESAFDPQARSWVGACGLMQIMPATATDLGLAHAQIYEPEPNIAAAAKYIRQLTEHFHDIADSNERRYFVLAAYNGGWFHIRDAMALAQKHGKNPHRWNDVGEFVLALSKPEYYRDPVVKRGYMRGSETYNYVASIRNRYAQYRGFARPGNSDLGTVATPHRAKRKNKYKVN